MTLRRRMRPMLGTFVELALDEGELTPFELQTAFEAGFRILTELQQKWSFQRADSELSALNRHLNRWVALSHSSMRLLRLAQAMMHQSGGLFNCTLGQTLVERGILPDHGFGARRACGDVNALHLRNGAAKLVQPVLLCFDGIAKGLAVDLTIAAMRRAGVKSGFINAGGDIRAFGNTQIPVTLASQQQPAGLLKNAAIATSSSISDARCPGLLLSADAEPLPAGQWTVIAGSAWRADALTKVAAASAGDQALLQRLGGRLLPQAGAEQPVALVS